MALPIPPLSPFSFPNYSTSPPLLCFPFGKASHSLPSIAHKTQALSSNSNLNALTPKPNSQTSIPAKTHKEKSTKLFKKEVGSANSDSCDLPLSSKSNLDALTSQPNSQTSILAKTHKEKSTKLFKKEVGGANSDSYDLPLSSKSNLEIPMFQMTLSELLDKSRVSPLSVSGNLDLLITGIQHDSREVTHGDLFICCLGSKTDGHNHLNEAVERGALAVMADKEINVDKAVGIKAAIIVEDTNSILPLLAATFYKHPSKSLSVIGITGTNGKTTTTHLVKSISEAMGLKTGMLGTLGYSIHGGDQLQEAPNTTPNALSVQKLMANMVRNGSKVVAMEVSSHGLALGRCNEIDFDVAVFTNLTRDHLDFHGTEQEYRKSKGRLFARMVDPEKHRKVVNIDDPSANYFTAQGNANVPIVTYGMENKNADVKPLNFDLSLFETRVWISTPKGEVEISSGLVGRYNIYNILAAVAVGIAVGAPLEAIVGGIESVEGVSGRCELIDEGQGFGVIVDYAHTPDALSRLLDSVRELSPRRIITVFGCGGERDRGKRPLMTKIAAEKSDVVILTSDNPRNEDPLAILDDMLAGIGRTVKDYLPYGENGYKSQLANGHKLLVHEVRRIALQAAIAMGEEGDIVVVAGKGHETYQIEGDKKKYFDDREECREALRFIDELCHAGIDTSGFPWNLPENH